MAPKLKTARSAAKDGIQAMSLTYWLNTPRARCWCGQCRMCGALEIIRPSFEGIFCYELRVRESRNTSTGSDK